MNLLQNKKTRALILIMSALFILGIIITRIYYKHVNNSIDPRILDARNLYENYNIYSQNSELDSVFHLLDTIEGIYNSTKHYNTSFETGVLYNNRAAAFLTMALYSESSLKDSTVQDSLIKLSEVAAQKSIDIYNAWLLIYEGKSAEEVEGIIIADFYSGLELYNEQDKRKYLNKRIKEIIESQIETPRRLSVSYTNLGIIYRHKNLYEEAAQYYKKAIDLWDRNLTAENNLNLLLNRPIKKRSFIQKMFPPERK